MNEYDIGGRRAAEFGHRAFWALFEARHPDQRLSRAKHGPWFWQRALPAFDLVVTMYVAPEQNLAGVFFGRNEKLGDVEARLRPFQAAIEERLKLRPGQRFSPTSLGSVWRVNCFAEDNWPAMADWLVTEAARFERAVIEVLGGVPR